MGEGKKITGWRSKEKSSAVGGGMCVRQDGETLPLFHPLITDSIGMKAGGDPHFPRLQKSHEVPASSKARLSSSFRGRLPIVCHLYHIDLFLSFLFLFVSIRVQSFDKWFRSKRNTAGTPFFSGLAADLMERFKVNFFYLSIP